MAKKTTFFVFAALIDYYKKFAAAVPAGESYSWSWHISRLVRMRPTALMRSSVGVEHPTAHPRAGGCTLPLANVCYGLGLGRLTGRLASKVAAATRAQAGVSGPRSGVLDMTH